MRVTLALSLPLVSAAVLALLPAVAKAQGAPDLKALQGFSPGAWQVTAIGSASSSLSDRSACPAPIMPG